MSKKINAQVNRVGTDIYLNLRKEEIAKLDFNFQGSTTFKLIQSGALFNFPSRVRKDLLSDI